jgi:post-segregation antitoxin (ccd killing protein)
MGRAGRHEGARPSRAQATVSIVLCVPLNVLGFLQNIHHVRRTVVSQVAEKSTAERVHVGAFVDPEQRQQLVELARRQDRSVSSVLRQAIATELERERERDE